MDVKNIRLRELHQQVIRRKSLSDRRDQLYDQQNDLIGKVEIMKDALWAEQDDVKGLEGHSLSRYFYQVVGNVE